MISADNFNNLWNIEPIKIKSSDGKNEATIFKIEIFKSNHPIFSVKTEKEEDLSLQTENVWISLRELADARTIRVDPRAILTP